MYLNWDEVSGAANYKVYEKVDQDSLLFINQVKSTQLTVQNLDYGADKCYQISALDSEGEETELSSSACNVVLDPPHFTIQKMVLIEPSGNSVIDSRETGILQWTTWVRFHCSRGRTPPQPSMDHANPAPSRQGPDCGSPCRPRRPCQSPTSHAT